MELGPDIVLMDLNIPGIGGIEATHRITACSDAAVLVLTMDSDDESVFPAIRAGASGYLIKGADRGEVLRAVLGAAAGEAVLRPVIARRILALLAGSPDRPAVAPFSELTTREQENPRPCPATARQPGHWAGALPSPQDGPQLRVHDPDEAARHRPW